MTQELFANEGTHITWGDSGHTHAMTLLSLLTLTGRQGVTHDFTTAAHVAEFWSLITVEFDTAPVLGEVVELWWKISDGTRWTNDDGEGDIALSSTDKLTNCIFGGVVGVDEAALDIAMSAPRFVYLPYTEIAPIVFNRTVDSLRNTAAHSVRLIPIPPQLQDDV